MAGRGAIETRGNAAFDPFKASLGLMAAAVAHGAQVFERSAVRRIERDGEGVRVHTAHGQVVASRVIVATGYATPDFRPLAGRFRMHHTYVLATEPVDDEQRRDLGLGNVLLWDTDRPYHYVRWTDDQRLLIGGEDRPVDPRRRRATQFREATRQLRAHFEALLPALADIRTDYAWEGLFAMTPDSLPYIGPHRRYPRHLFALGYGGNGMTFGFMAARMLLEHWQGTASPDHALFAFTRGAGGA
ncbi:MAG: FAD-binding oxidoreductase [Acidobacteria bacterium]|nr:FAD-binding oxidoreductase [Acidobacteriota bacterium]